MTKFLSSGAQESITRLCFLLMVTMIMVWETYAVFTKTTVPHIEAILGFAGVTLGWKQLQEKKGVADVKPTEP